MTPDGSLWKKYLDGTATKAELQQLEAWLQSTSPQDSEWVSMIGQSASAGDPMPAEMAARLRQRLQEMGATNAPASTRHEERGTVPMHGNTRRRLSVSRWLAAASVLLLALSGLFFFRQFRRPAIASGPMTWDSIANLTTKPKLITLPDQTKIWLNQHAVLYVNRHYTDKRWVELRGEGYFQVALDEQHPFVAITGETRTRVLGTAFNIDNTPGRQAVSISLVRGKVSVQQTRDTTPVLLNPGETAMADARKGTISRSNTGVPDIAGWINGDLVFNQLPLADALIKFGAYYGITLYADDPGLLEGKTATAVYHRKESWQQALRHFLFIYHLTYKTDRQNKIFITRT